MNYSASISLLLIRLSCYRYAPKRQTFQMAIVTHATVLPPTPPPSKETHRIWAIPTSGLGRGWRVSGPVDPTPRRPWRQIRLMSQFGHRKMDKTPQLGRELGFGQN